MNSQLSYITLLALLLGFASMIRRSPSGEGTIEWGMLGIFFSYLFDYFCMFFDFIKDYKVDRIRKECSTYNNLNYQKTPTQMKKSPIQRHPFDFKIDAFQRSPLAELKIYQKDREEGLRKISRQRFLGRQPSLPYLKHPTGKHNQENIHNNFQQLAQSKNNLNPIQKVFHRNRYFLKAKTTHVQLTTPKIINKKSTQPTSDSIPLHHSLLHKQASPSKQLLLRTKHTKSNRQCFSAEQQLARESLKGQIPPKLRQLRRVLHRKKSSQDLKESKDSGQIPIAIQAQRLAYQGRGFLAQEGKVEKRVCFALQDFLNQWKQVNLT